MTHLWIWWDASFVGSGAQVPPGNWWPFETVQIHGIYTSLTRSGKRQLRRGNRVAIKNEIVSWMVPELWIVRPELEKWCTNLMRPELGTVRSILIRICLVPPTDGVVLCWVYTVQWGKIDICLVSPTDGAATSWRRRETESLRRVSLWANSSSWICS